MELSYADENSGEKKNFPKSRQLSKAPPTGRLFEFYDKNIS